MAFLVRINVHPFGGEQLVCADTRLLLSTNSESIADFEDVLVLLARSFDVIEALNSPAIMNVPC